MSWDTRQYLKYAAERARPAEDLLAQLPTADGSPPMRRIADLGCGTGSLARAMAERWPAARVIGVDNSPAMLAEARQLAIPGRLEFVEADLATWDSDEPVDLVVSNAALQWLENHERLLEKLCSLLSARGTLAVQMPNNLRAPSHESIYGVADEPRFAARLAGIGLRRDSVHTLAWYAERLLDLGLAVNAWETTYLHVFTGQDPVLEWLRGTALRPILAALDADDAAAFERRLAERLRQAYPERGGVTLLPMSRIFFLASRE